MAFARVLLCVFIALDSLWAPANLATALPTDNVNSAEVDEFDSSLNQLERILELVRIDVTANSDNSTALLGVINRVNETLALTRQQRSNLPTLLVTVMSSREVENALLQVHSALEAAGSNTVHTITRCIDRDSISTLDNSTMCVNEQLRSSAPSESDNSILSSLSLSFSSLSLPGIVACVSDPRFASFVQSVQGCVDSNAHGNSTSNVVWDKANALLANLSMAKSPLDPYMNKLSTTKKHFVTPDAHGAKPSAAIESRDKDEHTAAALAL